MVDEKTDLHAQNVANEKVHKEKMAEIERTAMRVPNNFDGDAAEWMIVGAAMASPQFHEYILSIGVSPSALAPSSEQQYRQQPAQDVLQSVGRSYQTKKPLDGDGLRVLRSLFGYSEDRSLSAIKQVARMKGIQSLMDQTKAIGADLERRCQMRSDAPQELAERCELLAEWLKTQAENLKVV